MRRFWGTCLVLGLGLVLGQGKAAAQTPLTPFLSAIVPAPGEKKVDKGHDDHKDMHDEHADGHGHQEEPPDLGLLDFFTTGWDEKFEERERKDRAPRFNLFRTRSGFLERLVAATYGTNDRADNGKFNENELAMGFEYALNRRFEIDAEPSYTWKNARGTGNNQRGLIWDFGARFQLIDTADTAVNFQVRALTPNSQLEESQTTLGFVLAGFRDLTSAGLSRTGLYCHIEYDALMGPREVAVEDPNLPAPVRASSSLTYSVALAKTLVDPEVPVFGDFTVFVAAFGATDLNGTKSGATFFSFTPGMRMNLAGREKGAWWLQTGIEIPVAGPRGFDYGIRVALYHDF